jgi:hypothetical protein
MRRKAGLRIADFHRGGKSFGGLPAIPQSKKNKEKGA